MNNDTTQLNPYFKSLITGQNYTTSPQEKVQSYFEKLTGTKLPTPGQMIDDQGLKRAQADTGDQSFNNYCEKFVEESIYGKSGLYPSAADAWNNYVQSGKEVGGNILNAPRGALIYFAGDNSNDGYGHAGIADGQGNFVSATSNGVKTVPLNEWVQTTGQKPLGYVIP